MTSAKGASAQPGSATGASTPFATVNVSPFLWCVPLRDGAAVARPPVPCFFFPDTWISSGGAAAGRRRGLPPRHPRVPSRPPVSPSDRARARHLRTTTRDRLERGFAAPAAPGPTRESSAARRRPENSPRPRSPPRRRPQPDVASFLPPSLTRRKTWNLVSDPSSDHIISWSAQGRTFTVWQPDLLESTQLPATFKHSNFASFVRQLNNYGFRKCHSDRFEFGVEGFEQGKPELLTTLRRHDAPRNKKKEAEGKSAPKKSAGAKSGGRGGATAPHVPGSGYDGLELGVYGGITSEVEQLKRDRLLLLKEVMRLREVQSHTQDQVRELSARLASTEQFQSRMMNFVDAVQSGTGLSFDAQGMQKFKEVAATRKRRQMFLPSSAASPDQSTPGQNLRGSLGSGSHNAAQGFSLQEMDDDDILPADPLAPDPDDALTSQMFGPLSPNPAAPIQLPEHEWLDMLGGHGAAGVGGGGGVDPIVGKLEPRVGVGGPLIRSASQDDDVGAEGSADPFVSSILDRGPSLEKQMSLGFLERMSSAEIGDMVKDMNINQPFDDEFARRVREIKS